jgi:hypothetical protein
MFFIIIYKYENEEIWNKNLILAMNKRQRERKNNFSALKLGV